MTLCACGCGWPATHLHHAIPRGALKKAARSKAEFRRLCDDPRNHIPLFHDHHWAHHQHNPKLPVSCLPDSVFEFAAEVLKPGPAYELILREYRTDGVVDSRLVGLLDAWKAEAA